MASKKRSSTDVNLKKVQINRESGDNIKEVKINSSAKIDQSGFFFNW